MLRLFFCYKKCITSIVASCWHRRCRVGVSIKVNFQIKKKLCLSLRKIYSFHDANLLKLCKWPLCSIVCDVNCMWMPNFYLYEYEIWLGSKSNYRTTTIQMQSFILICMCWHSIIIWNLKKDFMYMNPCDLKIYFLKNYSYKKSILIVLLFPKNINITNVYL